VPILDIIEPVGSLHKHAGALLYSRMMYPDHENDRACLYKVSLIDQHLNNPEIELEKKITISKKNLITYREVYAHYEKVKVRHNAGLDAAILLQALILQDNLYRNDPAGFNSPPSLKKAKDTLGDYYDEQRRHGNKIHYNTTYAAKTWVQFKPVCHLWAAHYTLMDVFHVEAPIVAYSAKQLDANKARPECHPGSLPASTTRPYRSHLLLR